MKLYKQLKTDQNIEKLEAYTKLVGMIEFKIDFKNISYGIQNQFRKEFGLIVSNESFSNVVSLKAQAVETATLLQLGVFSSGVRSSALNGARLF